MDVFLIEKLTVLRLYQRVDETGGVTSFRVANGQAVALAPGEWDAIGADFRARSRQSAGWLRWAILLQIPFAIAVLALTVRVSALGALADGIDALLPGVFVLAATLALPIAASVIHYRRVAVAVADICTTLARRPRFAVAESPARRSLHALEILALLWFGPAVFIDIYGTLVPDAFRNTPWTGRHMGWDTVIGATAFIGIVAMHLFRRATDDPPDTNEVDPGMSARRRRIVGGGASPGN